MAAEQKPIPLIVGAGPTGMMLSLWLQKFSVPHRIIDAAPTSGTTSRAMVMHARSLEFYRRLGLADVLVEKGFAAKRFVLNHNGGNRARVPVADLGRGLSQFPFFLFIAQDVQEALLEQTIAERGGKVERSVRLVDMQVSADGNSEVVLDNNGREERFTASYVLGCDGAHSAVRRSMGISMDGGTYDRAFFVTDIVASPDSPMTDEFTLWLSSEDLLIFLPFAGEKGRARLIGLVPLEVSAKNPEDVTFEDIKPSLRRNAPDLNITQVNWFSRYKVHFRIASRFRQDQVFLCGDAAHIHSPVGGQGMNTGLGDATNLAWKIAAVYHGAPPSLLETYEPERIPFAKTLVKTTDYAFTIVTGSSYVSYLVRNVIMPYIVPFAVRYLGLGYFFYGKTSQTQIEYRDSPMSTNIETSRARLDARAGDRLPWVDNIDGHGNDNYVPLESAEWQAHVYGTAPEWVQSVVKRHGIPFFTFTWTKALSKVGLRQGVTYLTRPDGHIGLLLDTEEQKGYEAELGAYLEKWKSGTNS